MKGALLILFFYVSNPLFTFGSDFHLENKDDSAGQFTISSTENHSQCQGICEEEEFYKLGSEEKKDFVPATLLKYSKPFSDSFISVPVHGTFQKFQDRSYLYKIGVLRL